MQKKLDKQGYGADLKRYMDKRINIKLKANRKIVGVLKGYDQFMNIVLEDCSEINKLDKRTPIGTVMLRGNSIVMWECIDKIH